MNFLNLSEEKGHLIVTQNPEADKAKLDKFNYKKNFVLHEKQQNFTVKNWGMQYTSKIYGQFL